MKESIQLQPKARPTCTLAEVHVEVATHGGAAGDSNSLISHSREMEHPSTPTVETKQQSSAIPAIDRNMSLTQDVHRPAISPKMRSGSSANLKRPSTQNIPFPSNPSPVVSPTTPNVISPLSTLSSFTVITATSHAPFDPTYGVNAPTSFLPCAAFFSSTHSLLRSTASIVGRAISRLAGKPSGTSGTTPGDRELNGTDKEWKQQQGTTGRASTGSPIRPIIHTFAASIASTTALDEPLSATRKRSRRPSGTTESSTSPATTSSASRSTSDSARKGKKKPRAKKQKLEGPSSTTSSSSQGSTIHFPTTGSSTTSLSALTSPPLPLITTALIAPEPVLAVRAFVPNVSLPTADTTDMGPSIQPSSSSKPKPPLPPLQIPSRPQTTPSVAGIIPATLPLSKPSLQPIATKPQQPANAPPTIYIPPYIPPQGRRPRIPSGEVWLLTELYRSLMQGLERRRKHEEALELRGQAPSQHAAPVEEGAKDLGMQDALLALRLKKFLRNVCGVREIDLEVDTSDTGSEGSLDFDDFDLEDDAFDVDLDDFPMPDSHEAELDAVIRRLAASETPEGSPVSDEATKTSSGTSPSRAKGPSADVSSSTSKPSKSPSPRPRSPPSRSPVNSHSQSRVSPTKSRPRSRTPSPTQSPPLSTGANRDTRHLVAILTLRKRNQLGRKPDFVNPRKDVKSALRNEFVDG